MVRTIAERAGVSFAIVASCIAVCAIAAYLAVGRLDTHFLTTDTRSALVVDYGPDNHVSTLPPVDNPIIQATQNDVGAPSQAAPPGNERGPSLSLPTATPKLSSPVLPDVLTKTPVHGTGKPSSVTLLTTMVATPAVRTSTSQVTALPTQTFVPGPSPVQANAHPAHDPAAPHLAHESNAFSSAHDSNAPFPAPKPNAPFPAPEPNTSFRHDEPNTPHAAAHRRPVAHR